MTSDESLSESWLLVQEGDLYYSQDEVVTELTSFYEFLATMYMPSERIKYPPPEGWNIKQEGIVPPINNTVLSLLNRIPYLEVDDIDMRPTVIYWRTQPIDYSTDEFREEQQPEAPDEVAEWTYTPPHVVRLTRWVEDNGQCCFLDTERGTISWVDFMGGSNNTLPQHGFTNHSQDSDDFPSEYVAGELRNQDWRDHATYSVRDFFEMLKIDFRVLGSVPISFRQIEFGQDPDGDSTIGRAVLDIQEVYRQHGWPGSEYQKDQCLERVAEIWAKL